MKETVRATRYFKAGKDEEVFYVGHSVRKALESVFNSVDDGPDLHHSIDARFVDRDGWADEWVRVTSY